MQVDREKADRLVQCLMGRLTTVGPRSTGRPEFPKKFRYCEISGTARLSLQGKLIRNSENQFATARFPVLRGPVLQGSTVAHPVGCTTWWITNGTLSLSEFQFITV